MNYFVISDDVDTLIGLRLAGMPGQIARSREEAEQAITGALSDRSIGILLITQELAALCREMLSSVKQRRTPLVVEIPSRNSDGADGDSITRLLGQAIGIRI